MIVRGYRRSVMPMSARFQEHVASLACAHPYISLIKGARFVTGK
jgi:hypothetical protein